MQQLFLPYLKMFCEYYFLLIVISVLLCLHYPRKNRLALRIVVSILLSAVAICVSTVIYIYPFAYDVPDIIAIITFVVSYLISFSAVFFTLMAVFSSQKKPLLFNVITAFAFKQISENIFVIFASFFPELAITTELFSILRRLFFIPCIVFFYFVVIRRVNAKTKSEEVNNNSLIASVVATICCILFNAIVYRHMNESVTLTRMSNAAHTVFLVFIVILKMGVFEKNALIDERAMLQQTWKEKEKQLTLFKENINTVNIKYHDLKRTLSVIRAQGGYVPEQLLSELESSVTVHETFVETGNDTLDVILTQYQMKSAALNVRFSCIADGKLLSFMSSTDIIALVSNILENAIDAVTPLVEEERSIGFVLQSTRNMVMLHVENTYLLEPIYNNGDIVSAKDDKSYHGFGLKSIRAVVKKYGGDLSIENSNKVFKMNIIFYGLD